MDLNQILEIIEIIKNYLQIRRHCFKLLNSDYEV